MQSLFEYLIKKHQNKTSNLSKADAFKEMLDNDEKICHQSWDKNQSLSYETEDINGNPLDPDECYIYWDHGMGQLTMAEIGKILNEPKYKTGWYIKK